MFFSGPNILSALCGYYTCTIRPDPYFRKSAHSIHICVVIMNEISISVIYFLSVYDYTVSSIAQYVTADMSPTSVL